jgi:hypothetical protein
MYASEDGSGWYCMPELGDRARIGFPDLNDGNAYASSAVSTYSESDPEKDRMGDSSIRYLRNPQGMEVILTPTQCIVNCNGACSLILDENGNIMIHADQKLSFKAGENIYMYAEDTISIEATNNINLKVGKAEINMDNSGVTHIRGNRVFTN